MTIKTIIHDAMCLAGLLACVVCACAIDHESGISVRQAYRRLRNIEVSAENESFDYEAETLKGEWV